MNETGQPSPNQGSFVISLDTELSWGCFDTVGVERHREAYRNTRNAIERLCALFDRYEAPVTWALVMHLLDDCDGHDGVDTPDYEWIDDWYRAAPCSSETESELWYAPEILEEIRSREVAHEIGLHGYSHLILGESSCTRDAAEAELQKSLAVAEEHGIEPETFIFPRNSIGHLDLLKEYGIRNYRGRDDRWYERLFGRSLRRPLRFVDEFSEWTPPVVTPKERNGLTEVPGSQILRPFHSAWRYTPENSQFARAVKGLEKAAETGKTFHLWFHPFNIAVDLDRHLQLMERILSYADRLREGGRLTIRPIRDECVPQSR